jgi:transposase
MAQHDPKVIAEALALIADGHSQGEASRQFGIPQPTISRWLKERNNGNLPALPSVHPIASQRTSALPVHPDASELDDLKARVATLEAFMAVLQEQQRITVHPSASAHRSAPERTEPPIWKSHGQQFAEDTDKAMAAYAAQHRLEKREVWDLAARFFLAQMAEQGGHDA